MTGQPPVGQGLLDTILVVVLALCVVLALLVVVSRLRIRRLAMTTRERLAPLRGDLLLVGAGEDESGAARERLVADRQAGLALDRAVVELLTKVRGGPAEDLVDVLRQRRTVDVALRSLTSRSSVQRARATRTLGLLRDPALADEIVGMLDDRSGEVRIVAARAVGALGPSAGESAAHAVLLAVRNRRSAPGVPATVAMGTLTQLGMEAEPAVTAGLHHADPGVRNVAAAVAGHSLFLRCGPRLFELAAADEDRMVRVSAIEALGRVGREDDGAALARLLLPSEPSTVRWAAARALGELGGPDAVEALLSVLSDGNRFLAVTAANALAQTGPGREALHRTATGDAPESSHSAVAGVLQMLQLQATSRGH